MLRGIVALLGIVIAIIVVGGAVFVLLPTVGLAVSVILGSAPARRAAGPQAQPRL